MQQCGIAEHLEWREAGADVFQTPPDHTSLWEILFFSYICLLCTFLMTAYFDNSLLAF